jgi:K+-sensing histidine kinase KdpD
VAAHPRLSIGVGVIATAVFGLSLVPFRDTVGAVGVALVMAAIIVLAAEFGGRVAGVVVGLAGSVSFNVLHTRPYLEPAIADTSEAIAAVLLIAFGLLVGSWHRKSKP